MSNREFYVNQRLRTRRLLKASLEDFDRICYHPPSEIDQPALKRLRTLRGNRLRRIEKQMAIAVVGEDRGVTLAALIRDWAMLEPEVQRRLLEAIQYALDGIERPFGRVVDGDAAEADDGGDVAGDEGETPFVGYGVAIIEVRPEVLPSSPRGVPLNALAQGLPRSLAREVAYDLNERWIARNSQRRAFVSLSKSRTAGGCHCVLGIDCTHKQSHDPAAPPDTLRKAGLCTKDALADCESFNRAVLAGIAPQNQWAVLFVPGR